MKSADRAFASGAGDVCAVAGWAERMPGARSMRLSTKLSINRCLNMWPSLRNCQCCSSVATQETCGHALSLPTARPAGGRRCQIRDRCPKCSTSSVARVNADRTARDCSLGRLPVQDQRQITRVSDVRRRGSRCYRGHHSIWQQSLGIPPCGCYNGYTDQIQ